MTPAAAVNVSGRGDRRPGAAVVVFPGSNGDRDLLEALDHAGFCARLHPAQQALPSDVQLVGLPGGFSYGDYWRAGVLASRAPAVQSLPAFVGAGGLVIGVCNGFQILVQAGILPGALSHNLPPRFVHRWIEVEVTAGAKGRSPAWFSRLEPGSRLRLPIAHAEGRYIGPQSPMWAARVPLVYCENPNGSQADAAAILDESGRVLGLMPHPERACDALLGSRDGAALFRSAHAFVMGEGATC
jgi:phosphoribosylformylglycinamidine synthase subunit PurQ / glutaminase